MADFSPDPTEICDGCGEMVVDCDCGDWYWDTGIDGDDSGPMTLPDLECTDA